MKTTLVFTLILFALFTLLPHAAAVDTSEWGLPEGAIARLGKGRIYSIAYLPDRQRLAVATGIGIWIYDAETGKELDLLTGHTGFVSTVAFSPDGNTIASGGYDETIRLWDVQTRREIRILTGH
ncbi:MAG: hypothetical protein OXN27_26245, partial [Candidatus Poribacteria bacterium]|nr:hypothetical protein [Candidatus Poribacteria bacterium]